VAEDLSSIAGDYLRDILDQPKALEDTFQNLTSSTVLERLAEDLHEGRFHRVVLTGMGSSFHALHPLNLDLVSHGFTSLMEETSELIHYQSRFFDPKTLIVAVSQSGQSAEMIRLIEMNRRGCPVIAVTNTEQSPLATHASTALLTHAGTEFSVSCKTYVTALVVLKWLADVLCKRDLRRSRRELGHAAPAVAAYLSEWENHVRSLVCQLKDVRHLFLVGRGASLAAVGTGALIVKEATHFHAEGMSSAAFRHGPLEMLGKEMFVLVFSGDVKTRVLNERLANDIQQQGGRAELVGENAKLECFRLADHGSSLGPVLEMLPVQMITLALALCAGRKPGQFLVATKVTTTE
jgi:glucosamine--fructose-6-phosphate aminotransferase (isomerizing)